MSEEKPASVEKGPSLSPTIVVTGFQPFGGQDVNPALEAVRTLPKVIGGAHIVQVEVPVTYRQAFEPVSAAIEHWNPQAVVCVGQAAGRSCVTIERVAINVDDCDAPDNADAIRCNVPIVDDGPAAYFATLPVHDMVRAIEAAGLPAKVSDSAGTYVCNHLMYLTLDSAAHKNPGMLAGFIHVPLLHEQVIKGEMRGKPSMSKDDIVASLTAALETLAKVL